MDQRRLIFSRLIRETQIRIAGLGATRSVEPSARSARELAYFERRYDWLRRTFEALPRDDANSAVTDKLPRRYAGIRPRLPIASMGDEKETLALIFKEEARQLRSFADTAAEYDDLRARASGLANRCSALATSFGG